MPAKVKTSSSDAKAPKPVSPTKDYVDHRWNIDCQFRLWILMKSDTWVITKECWLLNAGRITGFWTVKRSVLSVQSRCFHFATDMLNADGTPHKFQLNGLLLLPRKWKNFPLKEHPPTEAMVDHLTKLVKKDRGCGIDFSKVEGKEYAHSVGNMLPNYR
jgi:hypothetical protein